MFGVKVVGHVNNHQEPVYVLLGSKKLITWHTAFMADGSSRTFWSPLKSWPSLIADKLGLRYKFMRNATQDEINKAIITQEIPAKKVVV